MNILIVSPRLPSPPEDGGAIYIFNFMKQLHKFGHSITLVSFYSNLHKQEPHLLEEYCEEIIYEKVNFKPYDIRSIIYSLFSFKPVQVLHRMNKKTMEVLVDRIPSSDFDFIFFEGIHVSSLLSSFKEKFNRSIFVSRSSNVEHVLLERISHQEQNIFKKMILKHQAYLMKIFEKKILNQFDLFTTISEHDNEVLTDQKVSTPSFVMRPVIKIPDLKKTSSESTKILIFGDWNWKPNSQGLKWFLNKVWPTVKKDFHKTTLTIVGKGLSEEIVQIINECNGGKYLGFVDDLDALKQRATMCCAPLFSGSGVKIKVLESLAAGLPLVTTDLGAEGIEIEHDVHYLNANTPAEFIYQISRLIESSQLRKKLSSTGKQFILREYELEKEALKIDAILREYLISNDE
jgi:glycosyltransferase involved in cell wall biosynthesis